MKNIEFVISVVLTVGTAFVIAIWVPGNGADKLKLAFEYGMLVLRQMQDLSRPKRS